MAVNDWDNGTYGACCAAALDRAVLPPSWVVALWLTFGGVATMKDSPFWGKGGGST